MSDLYANCTKECEAAPRCLVRIRELEAERNRLLNRLNGAEISVALLTRERNDATRRAVNAERDAELALRRPRDPSALARHYIDAAAADGDGWRNLKVQAEADVSMVVEATAEPPTVADLLRVLPVVEWRDDAGWWRQGAADNSSRWWWADLARWSLWGASVADPDRPARLVPASEADADPATRGPIDGSGGGK